jgi:hypothetical protein
VFLLEPFTVLGVALGEPAVVVVSLNPFEVRPTLSLENAPNVLLERPVILKNLLDVRIVPIVRTNREKSHGLDVGFLGKQIAVQVFPWDVRVPCGFLVGPEHTESRTAID